MHIIERGNPCTQQDVAGLKAVHLLLQKNGSNSAIKKIDYQHQFLRLWLIKI